MSQVKKKRNSIGYVVSNKMQNTVLIEIKDRVKHKLYGKYVNITRKLFAHDENNICKEGDRVVIEECRPISKRKNWLVVNVLSD